MGFTVKATRREVPVRMLIHGQGGVGKTTFGASAPDPIFISSEDGLANIDANAVEPVPQTWAEVLDALDYIATLQHRTVVIDSLDWLEPLCWTHVCQRGGKRILGNKGAVEAFGSVTASAEHIEAFGYGKGYLAAVDEWRVLIRRLQSLQERNGMHVVLIAHSVRKSVKDPEKDDYEAWQIKLQEKAAGLFKEWTHIIGFAQHEVVTEDTSGRAKGRMTGKRLIRCNPNASYESKTRYALPQSLPLDWNAFAEALKVASASPVARLRAQLNEAIVKLADEDVAAKCASFLKERGETVASLNEALGTVNDYLAERATRKAS